MHINDPKILPCPTSTILAYKIWRSYKITKDVQDSGFAFGQGRIFGWFICTNMLFYIIFGTNLLTQSPMPVYVFPCF